MTDKIEIGKSGRDVVSLDLAGVQSTRLLVQADSRGGKSWMFRLIAERFIKSGEQVIVIDPEGEMSTIREVGDVMVLGGDFADAKISPAMGNAVGRFLAENPVSAVIDLSLMDLTPQRQFARDLFESWVGIPRKLWGARRVVLIDEAADFAPQSAKDACSLEAMSRFMRLGAKRGFIPIPCTQRFSFLNKDIANLCRSTMIGPTAPGDALTAVKLMGIPTREQKRIMQLDTGHWLVRGAAFNSKQAIDLKADEPISRPPTPDDSRKKRRSASAIKSALSSFNVLAENEAQEEAQSLDEARKRIAELKSQIQNQADVKALNAEIARLEKELAESQRNDDADERVSILIEDYRSRCEAVFEDWRDRVITCAKATEIILPDFNMTPGVSPRSAGRTTRKSATVRTASGASHTKASGIATPPASSASSESRVLSNNNVRSAPSRTGKPQQRIIDALGWWEYAGVERPTRQQVAFVAGYTVNGHFNNIIGGLKSDGLLDYPAGGMLCLTNKGKLAVNETPGVVLCLDALADCVRSVLRSEPQLRVFDTVIKLGETTREELAEAAGYTVNGHFNNVVGKLNTLGVLCYPRPGMVSLGSMFDAFAEAAA